MCTPEKTIQDVLYMSQSRLRAVCRQCVGCTDVHALCVIAVFVNLVQHIHVRPVLKHGPRRLTHVQVRIRDHIVHN